MLFVAGTQLAMDMTVFGVRDIRSIPDSGEFTKTSDAIGKSKMDPFLATVFVAASFLLFWA